MAVASLETVTTGPTGTTAALSRRAGVREILEFLGLPWEETCMKFYQSDRFVHTASHDQVRQPIYEKSIDRWRNYEDHLGPLRKLLGL